MDNYCIACGKFTTLAMFCSKACNDRQASDPNCPNYDIATGQLIIKEAKTPNWLPKWINGPITKLNSSGLFAWGLGTCFVLFGTWQLVVLRITDEVTSTSVMAMGALAVGLYLWNQTEIDKRFQR